MYCEQCGTRAADSARFCHRCGAKLPEPASSTVDRPASADATSQETESAEEAQSDPTAVMQTSSLPESTAGVGAASGSAVSPGSATHEDEAPVAYALEPIVASTSASTSPPIDRQAPAWAVDTVPVVRTIRRETDEVREETILPATPLPEEITFAEPGNPDAATIPHEELLPRLGVGRRFVGLLIDVGFVAVVPILILELFVTSQSRDLFRIIAAALAILYFPLGFSVGRTVGMWATEGRIARLDGGKPGILRGLVRSLVMVFSAAVLLIGFIWSFFDRRRQTWHDKAAGTIVIDTRRTREPQFA